MPLLRSLPYISTPESLYRWVRGTWIDLTAIMLLLLLPFLAWLGHRYSLDDTKFVIRRGVFLQRTSYIPRQHIATLLIERPFYLRPLGAVRLAIDTDAGIRHKADFRLTVSRRRACDILEQQPAGSYRPLHAYQPPWRRMALLSLLMSNSLSGVVLLAITFQQAGVLLGEGFQNRLLGELENAAGYVSVIPRTTALLALLVIAGWCVAAAGNLFRHTPFRAVRCADSLTIRTGYAVRRDYSCTVRSVNYADLRQSLFSRLLRLYAVFINCVGYGKVKNTMAVLIPACGGRRAGRELRRLLPECRYHPVELRPVRFSLLRYCLFPFWGLALLYPIYRVVFFLLPDWQELVYHLTFMAYIPCIWLLLVKVVDRYSAGISCRNGMLTLRYSRRFTLHTLIVPQEKVVSWQLRQTPFQRRSNACDLLLYTYNEYRVSHRVRNLPLAEVQIMMNRFLENKKDD